MPHLELPDLPDRLPCLTLWPEWVYGIVALGKDIENRGPWLSERLRRYQGQYIGILLARTSAERRAAASPITARFVL